MKGAFHAATIRQRSKSSPIVIGVAVRERETLRLTGATRSLSTTGRMKGRNARPPSLRETRAYQPERSSKPQSPATNGTGPLECKDWTPNVRRPDPRGTRPHDPASWTRIKDLADSRTSWDSGFRGIQDFAGPRTSWDSRLRRTQDFVGTRTSQTTGTLHTPDQDLVLWCSLREHKLSG